MGWVHRTFVEDHECELPVNRIDKRQAGWIWECEQCGKQWKVVLGPKTQWGQSAHFKEMDKPKPAAVVPPPGPSGVTKGK